MSLLNKDAEEMNGIDECRLWDDTISKNLSPMSSPIASLKDVHTEHCCVIHGCKYGGKECSVYSYRKIQSYPCESCSEYDSYDGSKNYDTRMAKFEGKLVKIPNYIDFVKNNLMALVWAIEHDSSLSPDYQVWAHELRLQYERDYK